MTHARPDPDDDSDPPAPASGTDRRGIHEQAPGGFRYQFPESFPPYDPVADLGDQAGKRIEPAPQPPPQSRGPFSAYPADIGIRLAARIIDHLIILTAMIPVYLVVDVVSRVYIAGFFFALVPFVYFFVWETAFGTTAGKLLVGLRVVGPDGEKPDPRAAALRNSFYLLAVVPFLCGPFLVAGAAVFIAVSITQSPTKQGKHDEIAGGTTVLMARGS